MLLSVYGVPPRTCPRLRLLCFAGGCLQQSEINLALRDMSHWVTCEALDVDDKGKLTFGECGCLQDFRHLGVLEFWCMFALLCAEPAHTVWAQVLLLAESLGPAL